ncbi:MAG: CapA family protein [Alistipes senegalensis]|nr:CapA family protein [Alistipes senegalensis]
MFSKITFLGDVMCNIEILKESKNNDEFCFKEMLSPLKSLLSESDYVVCNLETPVANNKKGYSSSLFHFNSPETLIRDLSYSGVSAVTIANNHVLDMGISGLEETIYMLKKYKIDFAGAYLKKENAHGTILRKIGNTNIAIVSYTDDINSKVHHTEFNSDSAVINILRPNSISKPQVQPSFLYTYIKKLFLALFGIENTMKIFKFFGHVPTATIDVCTDDDNLYFKDICKEISIVNEKADILFFCAHFGGQYNLFPGEYVKKVSRFLSQQNVDAIIGTHPHVVQKSELLYFDNKITHCAYSIGAINIHPKLAYINFNGLPQYSIAIHYWIDKKIHKITFSILKFFKVKEKFCVFPVDLLCDILKDRSEIETLQKEVTIIYNRFTKKKCEYVPIMREYLLNEYNI